MTIYNHQEYVYRIRFLPTGQQYIGCRYAKGCHPSEFWREGGYFTSSPRVHNLIEAHGQDAFVVEEIIECPNGTAYLEETKLLREMKCAQSSDYLNGHNNEIISSGSEAFTRIMQQKFGTDTPFESSEVQEKVKQTNLERYGYEYPGCNPEYQNADRLHTPEVRAKIKQTLNERFGGDSALCDSAIRDKARDTFQEKYGVDNYQETEEFREKSKQTWLKKYGVDNPNKTTEVRDKIKNTHRERYGVENVMQLPEKRAMMSEKRKAYFNNPDNYKECQHCGKSVVSSHFTRYHGDKCKHK